MITPASSVAKHRTCPLETWPRWLAQSSSHVCRLQDHCWIGGLRIPRIAGSMRLTNLGSTPSSFPANECNVFNSLQDLFVHTLSKLIRRRDILKNSVRWIASSHGSVCGGSKNKSMQKPSKREPNVSDSRREGPAKRSEQPPNVSSPQFHRAQAMLQKGTRYLLEPWTPARVQTMNVAARAHNAYSHGPWTSCQRLTLVAQDMQSLPTPPRMIDPCFSGISPLAWRAVHVEAASKK